MRLVFEPKSSTHRRRPSSCNMLLAHTQPRDSSADQPGDDRRRRPAARRRACARCSREWIAFRFATVTRRTQHPPAARSTDRIHILEGRQLVLLNIDKVIRIIREADEPKPALIAALRAVASARPRTSSRSACASWRGSKAIKIEQELKELRDRAQGELKRILGSAGGAEAHRRSRRSRPTRSAFGDERRTLIEAEAPAVAEARVARRAGDGRRVAARAGCARARATASTRRSSRSRPATRLYAVFETRTVDIRWSCSARRAASYTVARREVAGRARRRRAGHHADRPRERARRSRTTSPARRSRSCCSRAPAATASSRARRTWCRA